MKVIGVDPGESGGIAVIDHAHKVIEVSNMPDTPMDILEFLRKYDPSETIVYLEDVGKGMPGQSSSATAKFARHNGHLEMALLALGMRTVKATPQKWQKMYQLGKSGEYGKTEWKNRLKAKAQELFPDLGKKVTLKTCDALLIALYGIRNEFRLDNDGVL